MAASQPPEKLQQFPEGPVRVGRRVGKEKPWFKRAKNIALLAVDIVGAGWVIPQVAERFSPQAAEPVTVETAPATVAATKAAEKSPTAPPPTSETTPTPKPTTTPTPQPTFTPPAEATLPPTPKPLENTSSPAATAIPLPTPEAQPEITPPPEVKKSPLEADREKALAAFDAATKEGMSELEASRFGVGQILKVFPLTGTEITEAVYKVHGSEFKVTNRVELEAFIKALFEGDEPWIETSVYFDGGLVYMAEDGAERAITLQENKLDKATNGATKGFKVARERGGPGIGMGDGFYRPDGRLGFEYEGGQARDPRILPEGASAGFGHNVEIGTFNFFNDKLIQFLKQSQSSVASEQTQAFVRQGIDAFNNTPQYWKGSPNQRLEEGMAAAQATNVKMGLPSAPGASLAEPFGPQTPAAAANPQPGRRMFPDLGNTKPTV